MSWKARANCKGRDDLDWFGEQVTLSMARLCWPCEVRVQCLSEALSREVKCDAGVWGGLSEEQRRKVRWRRATLSKFWAELEEAAT